MVAHSIYAHRMIKWEKWYAHSFACVLNENEVDLAHVHQIKVEDILLDIAGKPKPWDSAIYARQTDRRPRPQSF